MIIAVGVIVGAGFIWKFSDNKDPSVPNPRKQKSLDDIGDLILKNLREENNDIDLDENLENMFKFTNNNEAGITRYSI